MTTPPTWPELIVWTGDLEDDCFASWGEFSAHCECLSDFKCHDPETRERWESQYWFAAVYRWPAGSASFETIFHSGEHAGAFSHGDLARAVCEAIMRGHALRLAVARVSGG